MGLRRAKLRLAALQSLLVCSGGVDHVPIKRADIVVLLMFDEIERGIGCIAGALSHSTHSACQIAHEKEADKWHVKLSSDTSNRKPLGGLGKDRVEDD